MSHDRGCPMCFEDQRGCGLPDCWYRPVEKKPKSGKKVMPKKVILPKSGLHVQLLEQTFGSFASNIANSAQLSNPVKLIAFCTDLEEEQVKNLPLGDGIMLLNQVNEHLGLNHPSIQGQAVN